MRLQWLHQMWMGLNLKRPFRALVLKIQGVRRGVAVSKYFCSGPHLVDHLEHDRLNSNYRMADETRHRALWCIVPERQLEVSSLVSA